MKAIVFKEYGSPDVLKLEDIPKPEPKDNEIRVKIRATTVGFGDLLVRNFNTITPRTFSMPAPLWLPTRLFFGIRKPKINILGGEFSGDVEAIGSAVTRFKVGDAVFGYIGQDMGANAEYLCLRETKCIALKPKNMSYEEATTMPYGAVMALPILNKANPQPGQKILIVGASGGIGSQAVQLAKHHFGMEVTGVCGTPRVDYVKSLGADHIIDYQKEDFTKNGQTYDVILDILGKNSFSGVKNSLKPNGIFLLASFKMGHLLDMLWTSKFGSKKVICALSTEDPAHLAFIRDLIEAGKVKTAIDRCFPLEQTADAHRYVEKGHRQAPVVITVA